MSTNSDRATWKIELSAEPNRELEIWGIERKMAIFHLKTSL